MGSRDVTKKMSNTSLNMHNFGKVVLAIYCPAFKTILFQVLSPYSFSNNHKKFIKSTVFQKSCKTDHHSCKMAC